MSGVRQTAMSGAQAVRSLRAVVVPEWLAEVVRPRRAPVPWPEMTRAAGFAPWPMSWYSHLPPLYARAALDVCRYMQEALGGSGDSGDFGPDRGGGAPPVRSRMRRSTYRALADLRAEFQRTMSEPPAISRRATAWWPAVIALEQVMDAITATALAVSRGAQVPPSGVRQLGDALRAVSEAAATGSALAEAPELPDDETLRPVTDAVRALLGVLGTGERLTV
jgi:hypothetical protein